MANLQDQEQLQFPLDPNSYKILGEIGVGVSAIVYKAVCIPLNSTVVAIKAIDLDRSRADFDKIRWETKTMSLLSHPNILKAHCSFTVGRRLWVLMPFMSAGSLQSIIASNFPDGLPESCIAVVLRETLSALSYLHQQGHLHRDIKAGNILMDSSGRVKLADFGVSASIYEPAAGRGGGASAMLTDVAGTPYWMAPEVIHSHTGYSFKADIWSFGITALELAHGRPPLSHLPLSKSLVLKITKRFRFSDYGKHKKERKFSKAFKDMVASCLDQDPSKRPSAEKLLKHQFFKNCKGAEFLVKNVLQGLPSVEERFKEGKKPNAEEDEEGEGDGKIVKMRRISGWNFNVKGFELDPVFPVESTDDSMESMSNPSLPEGNDGDDANSNNNYSIDRDSMVGGLMVLKRSLDEQREKVVNLIGVFSGESPAAEEESGEVIEKLKMEVEEEKQRNFELEMELEFLRLLISRSCNSSESWL